MLLSFNKLYSIACIVCESCASCVEPISVLTMNLSIGKIFSADSYLFVTGKVT